MLPHWTTWQEQRHWVALFFFLLLKSQNVSCEEGLLPCCFSILIVTLKTVFTLASKWPSDVTMSFPRAKTRPRAAAFPPLVIRWYKSAAQANRCFPLPRLIRSIYCGEIGGHCVEHEFLTHGYCNCGNHFFFLKHCVGVSQFLSLWAQEDFSMAHLYLPTTEKDLFKLLKRSPRYGLQCLFLPPSNFF